MKIPTSDLQSLRVWSTDLNGTYDHDACDCSTVNLKETMIMSIFVLELHMLLVCGQVLCLVCHVHASCMPQDPELLQRVHQINTAALPEF